MLVSILVYNLVINLFYSLQQLIQHLHFFRAKQVLFFLILKFNFCFLKFFVLKNPILFVIIFQNALKFLLIFFRFIFGFFLCKFYVLFQVFFEFLQLLQIAMFLKVVLVCIKDQEIFQRIFHCIKFFIFTLQKITQHFLLILTKSIK